MSQKRVVFEHMKGPLRGMLQILGVWNLETEGPFPPFLPEVHYQERVFACSLLTVKQRYALYREILSPSETNALATFHPNQE